MRRRLFLLAWALCAPGAAQAETVTWDCNPEADMASYRIERSNNGGQGWGVLGTVPHVPGCSTAKLVSPYAQIGGQPYWYRGFAIDRVGNSSIPSASLQYTPPVSPIGNPGGTTDPTLPASPYVAQVTPPAPPPTPPPVPPPTPNPSAIGAWTATAGEDPGTIVVTLTPPDDGTGKPAEVDVRWIAGPTMRWGTATSAGCTAFPCTIRALAPGTLHSVQAIPFRRVPGAGSAFGPFADGKTVTTAAPVVTPPPPPIDPPPPPPSPPPVDPPPPPTSDHEARLHAVEEKIEGIETMGQVLDAELSEIRATMRALCRALGGNCP